MIKIANKMRILVKKSLVERDRDGRIISVSVTTGAMMASPEDTIESLVERADVSYTPGKVREVIV
jgi:hypothetical protein